MRTLGGRLPSGLLRVFANHRSAEGHRYLAVGRAIAKRYGVDLTLRSEHYDAVLLALADCARLRIELEDALAASCDPKTAFSLRQQLWQSEDRIASLVAGIAETAKRASTAAFLKKMQS